MVPDDLAAAGRVLLGVGSSTDADALPCLARSLRDNLDKAGTVDRERMVFEERSMRRMRQPDGLSRYIIDSDIESGSFWDDVYDTLTSPSRGGVRFVDDDDRVWAGAISSDERTTDQYVLDSFTQLLQIAVSAESGES